MKTSHQFSRYYDLDWIKVVATFIVFLYHCSMFFNPFDWHIKNDTIDHTYFEFFSLLVGNWIMPLFFVISGIATFHALQKRNAKRFIRERFIRLGIPLLLGVFLLSPPQVYIERIVNHQFEGSFLQFFPKYFEGVYLEMGGSGNFAFFGHHLWYLLALLLFSMIALPLFLKLKMDSEQSVFGFVHFILLPIPLMIVALLLNGVANLGGWGIPTYFVLYGYGYYFFSRPSLRAYVRKVGVFTGVLSGISTAAYIYWAMFIGFPMDVSIEWAVFMVIRVIQVWSVLFFILFLGDKYLNFSNKALTYTSEASMPFYVLHQPIIILIGFFIYNLDWSVSVKMIFLIITSFFIIMFFYQFFIRSINAMRVLFGLRLRKKSLPSLNRGITNPKN